MTSPVSSPSSALSANPPTSSLSVSPPPWSAPAPPATSRWRILAGIFIALHGIPLGFGGVAVLTGSTLFLFGVLRTDSINSPPPNRAF